MTGKRCLYVHFLLSASLSRVEEICDIMNCVLVESRRESDIMNKTSSTKQNRANIR